MAFPEFHHPAVRYKPVAGMYQLCSAGSVAAASSSAVLVYMWLSISVGNVGPLPKGS